MSLMETVNREIPEAMKARDQARLGPLRMLKAALMNREVERGRSLTEAEDLQVVASLIKQRRESIEQFERGGRVDLASKESAEIAVLEKFLPARMGPEEVERIIDEVLKETGASSARDLGRVMKAVMPRLAGAGVDGRSVNELVRKRLGA